MIIAAPQGDPKLLTAALRAPAEEVGSVGDCNAAGEAALHEAVGLTPKP